MGKCEKKGVKPAVEVAPEVIEKVRAAAKGGVISCRQALELAKTLGVPTPKIGAACDKAGIRITGCQLGCF